ncbi:MAG TPA: enoyl-CoA hydratase-related protein [Acidimicrobiia bacterium]|nr:enoyl-CoA hydratase-related protein [Acidimicrobiia bacterium]
MADEPAGAGAGPVVLCGVDGGVATVTLNRPERMNAWNVEMEERYFSTLDALAADPEVRAIVVTGAGRGFCPGLDMDDLAGASQGRPARDASRTMLHALGVMKPMVAAVNGACAGIGLVQALACDVRFAASSARMSTSFARRGLVAEFGAPWFLERIVGHANALDLLLSARTIDAAEACDLGLVNRVVDTDRLLDEATAYARDIATNCSPVALAAIKRQVYDDWFRTAAASEDEWRRLIAQPHRRSDFREGVASYLEKRPPRFAPYAGTDPG